MVVHESQLPIIEFDKLTCFCSPSKIVVSLLSPAHLFKYFGKSGLQIINLSETDDLSFLGFRNFLLLLFIGAYDLGVITC
jgi:hypothetical protein